MREIEEGRERTPSEPIAVRCEGCSIDAWRKAQHCGSQKNIDVVDQQHRHPHESAKVVSDSSDTNYRQLTRGLSKDILQVVLASKLAIIEQTRSRLV